MNYQLKLKKDLEMLQKAFDKTCKDMGTGLPETIYSKYMSSLLPKIEDKPRFYAMKNGIYLGKMIPDASFGDNILIEYKVCTQSSKKNYALKQCKKYLKFTNFSICVLMNFEHKTFDVLCF